MLVHRMAAELTAEIVNAWHEDRIDDTWAADLFALDSLPVQHERREHESDGTDRIASLVALAEDAAPLFGAATLSEAATILNGPLATLNVQVTISIGEITGPHLHFDAHDSSLGQRLHVNCLVAMATLLADPSGLLRAGTCASSSCDRVFVDFTRSGHQRFCSRRCATRRHVSDHRRRAAAAR